MKGQENVILRLFEVITESYDLPGPILTTSRRTNIKRVKMSGGV